MQTFMQTHKHNMQMHMGSHFDIKGIFKVSVPGFMAAPLGPKAKSLAARRVQAQAVMANHLLLQEAIAPAEEEVQLQTHQQNPPHCWLVVHHKNGSFYRRPICGHRNTI